MVNKVRCLGVQIFGVNKVRCRDVLIFMLIRQGVGVFKYLV